MRVDYSLVLGIKWMQEATVMVTKLIFHMQKKDINHKRKRT